MHCLKGVPGGKTWSGAVRHCHDLHAQLLTLDVLAFDDSVTGAPDVDVVLKGIKHGISIEIAWQGDAYNIVFPFPPVGPFCDGVLTKNLLCFQLRSCRFYEVYR